jgi:hypothetical protein
VIAPAELQVVCDGTTTAIATPLVRASADGVHLRFRNTSGHVLDFGIDDETGLAILADSIPAEGAVFVYALGVGPWQVHCADGATRFAVVDPDGVYRSVALRCADASGTTGSTDYGEDARGLQAPLLDVARLELRGLQPGDVVDRGGYPAAVGLQLVRVLRGAQVVAVVTYADDGHGGWLLSGTQACKGSNVTVEVPAG